MITTTLSIDFSNTTALNPIKATQGDAKSRKVTLKLLNGGTPVNLTGCAVRVLILPFGQTTGLYEDCTITSALTGKVDYLMSGNACAIAGTGALVVEIIESGTPDPLSLLYSKEVPLQITPKRDFSGAIMASTVFSALQSALARIGLTEDTYVPRLTGVEAGLQEAATKLADIPQQNELKKALYNKKIINYDNLAMKKLTSDLLALAKRTTTVAPIISIYSSTGGPAYDMLWACDFCMTVEAFPEYFTGTEIADIFRFVADRVNITTYEVPDHISKDGVVYWTPGMNNNWGNRARLDVNCWLVHLMFQYYKKTNDLTLFQTYKSLLQNVMDLGLPYNANNGLVSVPTNMTVACFGYNDTVHMDGDVFMMSCLAFMAYSELSTMYGGVKDTINSAINATKCILLKNSINSTFFKPLTNINTTKHNVGLYSASTGLCKNQLDVWGSCFAVYLGISDVDKSLAVANYMVDIYNSNSKSDIYFNGGIRQVPKTNDFSVGTNAWESFITAVPYGNYQNGGYWTMPMPWVLYTISLVDGNIPKLLLDDAQANHIFKDSSNVYEWVSLNNTSYGATKFINGIARMFLNTIKPIVIQDVSYDSVKMSMTVNQLIPRGVSTKGVFNNMDFGKSIAMIDITNKGIKVINTGFYIISCRAGFDGNITGVREISVMKNETTLLMRTTQSTIPVLAVANYNVSELYWLSAGDIITANFLHTADIDINVMMEYTKLSVSRIS